MYNKLNRIKGTFKRKLSGVPDGAGGLAGVTYSSYTTSIYFAETSSFYGNYGGIRNIESASFGTNQSFEGKMRYRSAFIPRTTDILEVNGVEYALSNIMDADFQKEYLTFKAAKRSA
jgi:hypothetical protein